MPTPEFDEDLEYRINVLERPDGDETILANLPVRDVVYAVVGLVVLTVLTLMWGYGQ